MASNKSTQNWNSRPNRDGVGNPALSGGNPSAQDKDQNNTSNLRIRKATAHAPMTADGGPVSMDSGGKKGTRGE